MKRISPIGCRGVSHFGWKGVYLSEAGKAYLSEVGKAYLSEVVESYLRDLQHKTTACRIPDDIHKSDRYGRSLSSLQVISIRHT